MNHPEDYCHRCLGRNFAWAIDSTVWNAVMRPPGDTVWRWDEIICPQCFAELFEARFGPTGFLMMLDPNTKGAKAFLAPGPEDTK
jgi:hypothetical protein